MKIGEILELTQTKKLADIAKEHLEFGEKKAKEALLKAGCTFTRGKSGWFLAEGTDKSVLEQSIYDFVSPTRRKAPTKAKAIKPNASIDKSDNESEIKDSAIEQIENTSKEIAVTSELKASDNKTKVKDSKKEITSELDSIDMLLLQNQSEGEQRVYRGFYWDKDIIDFLDNVKHGNKSDLMNEIVRSVLKAKGLI